MRLKAQLLIYLAAGLLLLSFFGFQPTNRQSLAVAGPEPASHQYQGRLPIKGDPQFDKNTLCEGMRSWHDRSWKAIKSSSRLAEKRSKTRNLYILGRYTNDYTTALLLALRATGDLRYLDRAAELWENARLELKDAWTDGTLDGHLNWVWLEKDPSHHGKDLHAMDEAMAHGAVAALAFALHENREFGEHYAEKADFWRHYLEDHFLSKWNKRAGGRVEAWDSERGFYKRLVHPRANQLRIAYYLYRITDDLFYLERARSIAQDLHMNLEPNPANPRAYRWKHQLRGADHGYQKVNYAHYFMNVVLEMYTEGFAPFASDEEMRRFACTFTEMVLLRDGTVRDKMALRVDGSGNSTFRLFGLSGFARWDPSAALLDIATDKYRADSYGHGVSLAAGALLALSQRVEGFAGGDGPLSSFDQKGRE
jgi:hypothetical protein